MKKIMLIGRQLSSGGAEKVMAQLSIELSRLYPVVIVVFNGTRIDYLFEGELIDLKSTLKPNIVAKLIGNFHRIRRIKTLKKSHQITHTISFTTTPNIVNVLSKTHDQVITSIRNYDTDQDTHNRFKKWYMKRIYQHSDHVVAVSKRIAQKTTTQYDLNPKNIHVIYNPIQPELLNLKTKDKPSLNVPHLIHVGRFTKQKNHLNLLKIMTLIKQSVPQIQLTLLGEGPLEADIMEYIQKHDLINHVHCPGFVQHPEDYLAQAHIFVFPSLYEGFPNALLEAMACRLPVIASDCASGPREILAPNTDINYQTQTIDYADYGMLMPVPLEEKTIEIWAQAIINMITDTDLKTHYSLQAYQRAQDFNTINNVKAWTHLFEIVNK